ncbi:putative NRPS-like protein biosynthetic cluster [Lepraria neglecta]|uniref:NRPS-like protein biosynthetic cluster n=1 Tax=Lepraria neglecta TaxID=209136 RepID=A0AAD9Z9G4_9LECA|nr:putative NRPS-like protein biosynthetic cluster [Lepraria neglecta]
MGMEGTKAPSLHFTGDLLPHLVDKRAALTPNIIYSEYPVSTSTYEEGYRKITYKDFANAVNGAAAWLVDTLGPGKDFETLAYMGPNDIRYPALILGAVKAGYKLFLTSPRNSLAAQSALFDTLNCKTLLSSDPRPPAVNAISDHRDIHIVEVPSVSYLLNIEHHHFAYDRSWPEAQSEPLFVVHTSGSTGIPKPLTYTHASAAANTKMMSLDPPVGYESQDKVYQGKRVFISFPPFHVRQGTSAMAPTSGAVLSGEGLVESLKETHADVAFLVPSLVQDIAQNPELLDYCSKSLRAIIYCGGDLPQIIGDLVASRIRLLNQFGASELGLTPAIISLTDRGSEDWKYTQFHPQLGLELRTVSDDIYELYAVRNPEKIDTQPTFTIFPHAQEYTSRDLFVRHPSKPDLWNWKARADDIIVFLNGEKTNPISMEQHIVSRNADISAALVVGAQRFQAALLIEPIATIKALDPAERAAFIERIWPTVEEANKDAPSHARLMNSHILFTTPQKPMLRAGKGTVQRSGTLKSYASEIDALYRDAEAISADLKSNVEDLNGALNQANVSTCIRQSVLSIMDWHGLDDSANFFALGMDSLQALVLVRKLRQSLGMTVELSTLYTNPSVLTLMAAILHILDQHQASKASQEQARTKERKDLIQDYKMLIDQRFLPQSNVKLAGSPKQEQEVVVLTGSTGTLGSYTLDALIQNPNIAHIYCLNRAEDGLSTQIKKNRLLGLQNPPSDKRVSFLKVDLSQDLFHLTKSQYDELASKTTLVIHNAWTVNFNLSLSFFKPQLNNLVNLLAFANNSAKSARFFYISSISSVISYCSESGKTPEKPVTADSAPGPNGYSQSKYVAEHIIDYATQTVPSGFSLAFARVGQIAGATNHSGIWNKDEWFPSMIISSVQIGAIPESLGSTFDQIDWVPIDLLTDILVELALTRGQSTASYNGHGTHHANVYHPLNSHKITWTELRATVLRELISHTKKPMEVIPLGTWIAKVRNDVESVVDRSENANDANLEAALRNNPAARLLDFFEHLAAPEKVSTNQLECVETFKLSKTMRELEPIKDEWMQKWIREWFAKDGADHKLEHQTV